MAKKASPRKSLRSAKSATIEVAIEMRADVVRDGDTVSIRLRGGGLSLRFEMHAHEAARVSWALERVLGDWIDEGEDAPAPGPSIEPTP